MPSYIAVRDFPNALNDEDAQMAHWQSARVSSADKAVAALVEHMMNEARGWQKLARSSDSMAEGALELARLAGVMECRSGAARLAGVRTRSGVTYMIRKLG